MNNQTLILTLRHTERLCVTLPLKLGLWQAFGELDRTTKDNTQTKTRSRTQHKPRLCVCVAVNHSSHEEVVFIMLWESTADKHMVDEGPLSNLNGVS